MAPNNETKVVLYAILKFLLAAVSSVFQLHFLLFSNILMQHQTLQEEVKSRAKRKVRQMFTKSVPGYIAGSNSLRDEI